MAETKNEEVAKVTLAPKKRRIVGSESKVSKQYRIKDVRRVERKYWNKAVSLIESGEMFESTQSSLCLREIPNPQVSRGRAPSFSVKTSAGLSLELRQALLRHDWNGALRLYSLLLRTFYYHRPVCNKFMTVFLLSSPTSDSQVLQDFFRMVLGVDEEEVNVFIRTICKLPTELSRDKVTFIRDTFYKQEKRGQRSAANRADSYAKASLSERIDKSRETLHS